MNLADIKSLKPAQLSAMLDAARLEQERRKYRRLINFVEDAWQVLEPSEPYRSNWHIEVICEHLEAVTRGEIKNLLINIPPGCMKSLLVSVIWPAWEWRENQALRYFCASYGEDISIRDNLKCRDLIKSDWYQRLWPDVQIRRDNDQKSQYGLTGGGFRMASSVGGRGTGHHPDRKIVDDPHNVKQSESDTERQGGLSWFDRTLSSRGASRGAATIVIMQRLHEKDLSGHIMEQADFKKDWVHLCLPMEYEGERSKTPLDFKDPRTEPGELLWPSLYPKDVVKTLAMRLGEYGAAGQLQQRPSPAGGGILKTEHFQLWPNTLPIPDLTFVLQSYDTAFTENTANDQSGCTAWGIFEHKRRACAMLLDCWGDYLSYPKLRQKVLDDWHSKYGGVKDDLMHPARRADVVLIEEKGSGISLIQDLRRAGVPVVTYNPGKASKENRAHQASPILELDCIYLIESKKEPGKPVTWARPLVTQCEQFPNGELKDLVDTFTQAMIYLRDTNMLELPETDPDEIEDIDYNALRRAKTNPYG